MNNDSSTIYEIPDISSDSGIREKRDSAIVEKKLKELDDFVSEKFNKFEEEFRVLEKDMYVKIDDKIDKAGDKLESKQINSIQVLGIFVALFTFVSGSFQIYKMIDNINSAVVFTALVAGLSVFILFIITLLLFIRNKKYAFIWSTAVLVFSLGIIIYSLYFFQNNGVMKQTADSSTNQIITNNNNLEGAK